MLPILILASLSAPPSSLDRDREAVRAVLLRFETAWNRGDLEGMLKAYTDPHVDVNHPDQVLGHDETRALLAAHHPANGTEFEFSPMRSLWKATWRFNAARSCSLPCPERSGIRRLPNDISKSSGAVPTVNGECGGRWMDRSALETGGNP